MIWFIVQVRGGPRLVVQAPNEEAAEYQARNRWLANSVILSKLAAVLVRRALSDEVQLSLRSSMLPGDRYGVARVGWNEEEPVQLNIDRQGCTEGF